MKKVKVSEWHPYADKWHPREITCMGCGAVKPPVEHPKGWTKRYRLETRTQARCPACSAAGVEHPRQEALH